MSSAEGDIPTHVGYILDGNRRWAKTHGLPTYEGHLAGVNALEEVLEATVDAGVKYISLYTWSTENWKRAEDEVSATMKIIRRLLKSELGKLVREGCRLVVMGDRDSIPADIREMVEQAEARTADGARATIVMCFNYGGQQEIVRAANRALQARLQGVSLQQGDSLLSVEEFATYLDYPEVPPCDVIVRTSGEQRLSNFMLWRAAYSEFIFLDKYWPEMTKDDVSAILEQYAQRGRRFGG